MRPHLTTTILTYGLLTLAGITSFILPEHLTVEHASADPLTPPDVVYLPGTIRDFHKTSADLNVAPSAGNGHYAGNISLALSNSKRPVFIGGGYKVATEWKDMNSYPIPPHLAGTMWGAGGTIPVTSASPSPTHGTVDTYNSTSGPYGGSNIGPAPTYVVGAAMPVIVVPLSVSTLTNQGNLNYVGPKTISSDIHCNRMDMSGAITISGKITMYCEDVCALANGCTISLTAGSTFRLYVKNGGSDWNHVTMGDPLNPNRVIVYNMGVTKFIVHNHADVYAIFISPNASIDLNNHGALYGRFIGKTVEYDNHGDFHVDSGPVKDACNNAINDTAGAKGANSSGGIVSAASFVNWYTDVLGTNMSMNYNLVLTKNSSTGLYEYLNDNFNPIDNILYGNEGQAHNYYFTYMVDVKFTHKACSGTFLEFKGADDAWMFVDGQLAMDLGGVVPGTSQRVDMDRLNLVDGRTYTMQFFYAQRNASVSSFRMRTNLSFVQAPQTYTMTSSAD